jgi:uncharacterized protein (TIGR00299 family) protein
MKSLYVDIISGVSGDMMLAALLEFKKDLIGELNDKLSRLLNGRVSLSLKEEKINGIVTKHLNIETNDCEKPHRNLKSISKMLKNSDFPKNVVEDSVCIFEIIAEAESKSHNQPEDKVHFHEVGAIDSIIDIVGISYCVNKLNFKRIFSSPVIIGNGFVNTEHGILPVPAPATLEILKDIPLKRINVESELTTPTGAAVIRYYSDLFTNEFFGKIKNIAYSCGTKRFEKHPNMLRMFLLEEDENIPQRAVVIETNIDDDTGENLGFLSEMLFENGALDVSYTSIFMKKNRPAYKLTVLATPEKVSEIIKLILKNSTAAGLRYYNVDRVVMNRFVKKVKYSDEYIRIKTLKFNNIIKYAPEWDDVVAIARKNNIAPLKVFENVIKLLDENNL